MDVFTMIVCIVFISVFGGILGNYLQHRRKGANKDVLRRIEALEKRVADDSFEERLQALETIVTDKRKTLEEEFERL